MEGQRCKWDMSGKNNTEDIPHTLPWPIISSYTYMYDGSESSTLFFYYGRLKKKVKLNAVKTRKSLKYVIIIIIFSLSFVILISFHWNGYLGHSNQGNRLFLTMIKGTRKQRLNRMCQADFFLAMTCNIRTHKSKIRQSADHSFNGLSRNTKSYFQTLCLFDIGRVIKTSFSTHIHLLPTSVRI